MIRGGCRTKEMSNFFSKLFTTTSAKGNGSVTDAAWCNVDLGAPDQILGITEAYKKDSSPLKINLGVGAYRDGEGRPKVLESIKRAEKDILSHNKEYAAIGGVEEFIHLSASLAYGTTKGPMSLEDGSLTMVQSISGTGALRLGGEFIKKYYKLSKTVLLPIPTWGNHNAIFECSALQIKGYRYYDKNTNGLDLASMLKDLSDAAQGSIVLLHACAHNPTGVDPTRDEWKEIESLCKKKKFLVFFDMAYQGFASGQPDDDAWALRHFISEGHYPLVAQSYAKNMGLYGERAGTLSVWSELKNQKEILSQLKKIIRPMYSSPPIHGALLASKVLGDPEIREEWLAEVGEMSERIKKMRSLLKKKLEDLGSKKAWNHITDQIGMFCYTGLTPEQVDHLTQEHHIYLTRDGRISIAGITEDNVDHLAKAIHSVTSS